MINTVAGHVTSFVDICRPDPRIDGSGGKRATSGNESGCTNSTTPFRYALPAIDKEHSEKG
jgi:hypothetical protein